MVTCTKGWEGRCSVAKSKKCTCECGGANHGKGRAVAHLTNVAIFEPAPGVDYRYLLHPTDVEPNVFLYRHPNGTALSNVPHQYVVHSPDGFEWGYEGSGPSELALNILGRFVPAPEAWRLHQDYKRDVIANLTKGGPHLIPPQAVRLWIIDHWLTESAGVLPDGVDYGEESDTTKMVVSQDEGSQDVDY